MDWQPSAGGSAPATRRRSTSKQSDWHVDGAEGLQKAQAESKHNQRAVIKTSGPRHALEAQTQANEQRAAAAQGSDSAAFNEQIRKAEKAMLYRMRFEGEYMKKKQREFDKHSKREEEQKQMEANRVAVEQRIKNDRAKAQDALRRKKMMAQNRVVERSLSTGLAAFKRVKQAQKDAKRYSDMNVLLSEQYSHLNYLVEQKVEQIQDLEKAKRIKFMKRQQAAKAQLHHTSISKHKHKHKHKGHRNAANKSASIRAAAATQSGDTVPHMTIHQREREVEQFQHVVEHRLRNMGELARELEREKEEIDRLRRSLKQKKIELQTKSEHKTNTKKTLEEDRLFYAHETKNCEMIQTTIVGLKQQIEDDKIQFGREWDERMDTLTDYHRDATRQVEAIGGQSSKRAKSMRSRKLSHLSPDRHSRLMGTAPNMHSSAKNQQMVMRKERKAIKTMDEAFQAITRATGIDSLEELVDTFVHADRRNYSVVKHITALDRDVDELNTELRDLKELQTRLENDQHRNGLSRRQKVTAMARELDGLERQIEVCVAAHERDMRVINEIGPEVHGLFFQIGCRDPQIDDSNSSFTSDSNLMRMLGLVDQQTVLLMALFVQLDQEYNGGVIESVSAMEQQRRMQDAQALRNQASTLNSKPEPPKMGDFDEGEDNDMMEDDDETDSSSLSSSSSSDSEDDEGMSKQERRRKQKRKMELKRLEKLNKKKKRAAILARASGSTSAVQKPEPISNLRKSVQRQIETGQHRHNHSSVHRFERGKDHFTKRQTGIVGDGIGIGINAAQLTALQHGKAAHDIVTHHTNR